jgi:hypothetical protein
MIGSQLAGEELIDFGFIEIAGHTPGFESADFHQGIEVAEQPDIVAETYESFSPFSVLIAEQFHLLVAEVGDNKNPFRARHLFVLSLLKPLLRFSLGEPADKLYGYFKNIKVNYDNNQAQELSICSSHVKIKRLEEVIYE